VFIEAKDDVSGGDNRSYRLCKAPVKSPTNQHPVFPSVLWHCWLGDRKGIRLVKKLDSTLSVSEIKINRKVSSVGIHHV